MQFVLGNILISFDFTHIYMFVTGLQVVVSDSVPARDNFKKLKSFRQLTLAPMLAEAIRRTNNEESISAMFLSI